MTAVGRRTSTPRGDVRPDSGDLAEHHSSGPSGAPKAMRLAPNIGFLPPRVAGNAPFAHHPLDLEGSHGKCQLNTVREANHIGRKSGRFLRASTCLPSHAGENNRAMGETQ